MATQEEILKLIFNLRDIKNDDSWNNYVGQVWYNVNEHLTMLPIEKDSVRYVQELSTDDGQNFRTEKLDDWVMGLVSRDLQEITNYLCTTQVDGKVKGSWYSELELTLEFLKSHLQSPRHQDSIWSLIEMLSYAKDAEQGLLGSFPRAKIRALATNLEAIGYLPYEKGDIDGYPATILVNFLKLGEYPIRPFNSLFSARAFNTFNSEINKIIRAKTGETIRKAKDFDRVFTLKGGRKPSERTDRKPQEPGKRKERLLNAIQKLIY